jgi:pantothenate kinase type III
MGLAATAVVYGISAALPSGTHMGSLGLVAGAVLAQRWRSQLKGPYERHLAAGGAKASPWKITVVMLLLAGLAIWAAVTSDDP